MGKDNNRLIRNFDEKIDDFNTSLKERRIEVE